MLRDGRVRVLALLAAGFRVQGDDVPGVQEAWDEAEAAEQEVDDRVGGADADFHPHGDRGEEDGEQGEEDVACAHGFVGLVLGVWTCVMRLLRLSGW